MKQIDPSYYEVKVTLIPHNPDFSAREYVFYKTRDLIETTEGNYFRFDFYLELDEGRGLSGFEKDLKIASRCHCYEDRTKEDD